jgi:hypothetical protein
MPLTVHAPACVIGQHVNVYVRVRRPLTRDLTVHAARRYRVTFQTEVVEDVFGDHGAWLIRLLNALPLNPAPKPFAPAPSLYPPASAPPSPAPE